MGSGLEGWDVNQRGSWELSDAEYEQIRFVLTLTIQNILQHGAFDPRTPVALTVSRKAGYLVIEASNGSFSELPLHPDAGARKTPSDTITLPGRVYTKTSSLLFGLMADENLRGPSTKAFCP